MKTGLDYLLNAIRDILRVVLLAGLLFAVAWRGRS